MRNARRIGVKFALWIGALGFLPALYCVNRWHDGIRLVADAAPALAALGLTEVRADFWEANALYATGSPAGVAAALIDLAADAPDAPAEKAPLTLGDFFSSPLRGLDGLCSVRCTAHGDSRPWGHVMLHRENGILGHIGFSMSPGIPDGRRSWLELALPVTTADLARRVRANELAVPNYLSVDQNGSCMIGIGSRSDHDETGGIIVGGKLERLTSRK